MKWRLLPFLEQAAALNMATDQSILEHIQKGKSLPTIRFYAWQSSAVTLGTFQCRDDEVDVARAKKMGVDVVRRVTGGGAVYHDREGDLIYSIIAPERMFEKGILKSYEQICNLVVNALGELGINAKFKPINDVMVGNRKISGSAQTRRRGVLLQHGTLLYDVDVNKMFSLLKIDKVKVSDKFISSVNKLVTSVKQQKAGVTRKDVIKALTKSFTVGKEYEERPLTETEIRRAETLVKEKYGSEKWNNCRR